MKEELISFDTAKLAKEKGFDNYSCIISNITQLFYAYNKQGGIVRAKSKYSFIYAPTQSLLQKWLREIHKLDVISTRYLSKGCGRRYVWYIFNEDNKYVSHGYSNGVNSPYPHDTLFASYEEALEKGLQEALKLI